MPETIVLLYGRREQENDFHLLRNSTGVEDRTGLLV